MNYQNLKRILNESSPQSSNDDVNVAETYDGNEESELYKYKLVTLGMEMSNLGYSNTMKNKMNHIVEFIKAITTNEQVQYAKNLIDSEVSDDNLNTLFHQTLTLKNKIINYGINVCDILPEEISMSPRQIELLIEYYKPDNLDEEYHNWLNEYKRVMDENDSHIHNLLESISHLIEKGIDRRYMGILN